MKKIILLFVAVLLTNISFSQEKHSRIKINNPDQSTLRNLALEGVDLKCGAIYTENSLILELSDLEINSLKQNNVSYEVVIDDMANFYSERAKNKKSKPKTHHKSKQTNNQNQQRSSISSVVQDNIIQYIGADEINWVQPANFHFGTMGNCLTVSEMQTELDEMYTYSQTNGLDIVSQKLDASPTGQKTWGNPATTITNPQDNGPANYTGQGTSRWDPQTIYYIRITGNQSTTAENTKPQMFFNSMVHSREVSALMNNIYFMWYLIENYNTDAAIKELVDNNELYFVPVVNPDGLRWNEHLSPTSGGGSQRKNCRPNTGGTSNSTTSRGVDLNRNFDYFWNYNNVGSSGSETGGTYRGPSAASEPETQIMVDFILAHNFRTALWNHSYANSIPHPYGGIPGQMSNREDEMHRWHEEMTRYNRYIYGATIFYESNGLPDDWMVGSYDDGVNPPTPDLNGSLGSGQGSLATTPEHGSTGFWPTDANVLLHAENSLRISLATAYYGGKYGKLHDLTQSNITGLTSDLDFAIERIGQTASDFTVTVTPISANIVSITSPTTETGMDVLEQRTVTAQLQLNAGITANEKIEYNIKFSNNDGIIYEVNFEKYYQPSVLFDHNPDINGISGWTQTGGWNNTAVDAYTGSNALRTGNTVPYAVNNTKTLTTTSSYDFSSSNEVLIQFYTKWDIERNYDFVEILGSTNGTTWQALSGKYTKPNATGSTTNHDNKGGSSNFQANSEGQVYDGDKMDNWVMEEIVIDASNNSFLNGASTAQIRFNFRSDASDVSENFTTTSDGFFIDDFKIISLQIPCTTNVPTGLASSAVLGTTATVSWNSIPSATYDLRYREAGTSTWTDILDLTTTTYNITGLNFTTQYEAQVRSKCTSTTSAYSTSIQFTTTDVTYCDANGNNTNDEYIGNVTFNSINNTSTTGTTSVGYSNYTVTPTGSQITDLEKNSTHMLSVTKTWPTSGTGPYDEAIGVWIDYNKDGVFDDATERVMNTSVNQTTPETASVTIPGTAQIGETRMRVVLRYNTAATSCDAFNYGEVEDYKVNIIEQTLSVTDNSLDSISVYPNPFNNSIGIKLPKQINNVSVELFDLRGRKIFNDTKKNHSRNSINISNLESLSNGAYLLKITDLDSNTSITKKMIK